MNKKNINVIIVNGLPGCGKTTFEEMCGYMLGPYYRRRSSVDKVKEIAQICGWNGEKTLEARAFLSDLKKLLTKFNDLPFKDIEQHINEFQNELDYYGIDPSKGFIFIDVREPNEIQRMKEAFNATTLLIQRDAVAFQEVSNCSDAEVNNYKYDYVVHNNGTYEELHEEAERFLSFVKFDK
jgi:predicted AAA+ superfamily ATPase